MTKSSVGLKRNILLVSFLILLLSISQFSDAMIFKSDVVSAQWDTWAYYHEGMYYLYYLITEHSPGEGFGVATSPDGVHWTDHGWAIRSSEKNSWYLGTGSVWKSVDFEQSGKFICNYSEHRNDGNRTQNILFAWSTDLINWTKYDDSTMFKVDTRYYDQFGRWDCIFAFPREEGGYWGTWTATSKDEGAGGVGIGYSDDGLTWNALPFAESNPGVHESGAIYPVNGRYYGMFGKKASMLSFAADQFTGPYVQSPKNSLFLERGPTYFSRFLPTPDELLVNHHSMSGTKAGNRVVTYAAPLKKAIVDAEGIMRWKYWQGNEAIKGDTVKVLPHSSEDIQLITDKLNFNKGIVLEADITLPAGSDEPASVIFFAYGKYYAVRVSANGVIQVGTYDSTGTSWSQSHQYDRQWNFGAAANLRVLARAGMMEIYLDDHFIECWTMGCYGSKDVKVGLLNVRQAVGNVKVWQMSLPEAKAPLLISPIAAIATASSIYSTDFCAEYAVDGNRGSRWCSATPPGTKEWLQLDFGSEQKIEKVIIDWEVAYASSYELNISSNARQWQKIHTVTDGDGRTDVIDGLSASCRYLRFDFLEPGSEHGYSIYETKVFPSDSVPSNNFENGGFETGDLTGWNIVAGTAFSDADVTGVDHWSWGENFLFAGDYHLWGFKSGGDGDTGTMTSGKFIIGNDGRISFRIAGGDDIDNLYLALVRISDGMELFRTTGHNHERYRPVTWNASEYIGQEVYFVAVDNSTGRWGHLNLDDIRIPTGNNLAPPAPYDATVYNESRRNQYHYSAPQGWHNDVNGPVYYNGKFHLFHQHHPTKETYYKWTGPMHWGHATSTDLVHWKIQPIALHPDWSAANRLFSGGGVVDVDNTSGLKSGEDDVIALFTGTEDKIHMCYSTDGGRTFKDYKSISVPYINVGVRRDPKVFWYGPTNKWIMVIYEIRTDVGKSATFYSSFNLVNWSYESTYASGLYECPDMYQLEVLNPDGTGTGVYKWVLSDADFEYEVGDFDGHRFTSNMGGAKYKMESAPTGFNNTYASLTYENVPGRRIQQSWMGQNNGGQEGKWDGCMSFPLELNLVDYGKNGIRITRKPVAEIVNIYTGSQSWTNQTITSAPDSNPLKDTYALYYELIAEFDLAGCTADSFGLHLRVQDSAPAATVIYDKNAQTLNGHHMPPTYDNKIKIHVLVDRDALEFFGNDGYISYQGNTWFEDSPYNQAMKVIANGGSVNLSSLRLNRLDRIWEGSAASPASSSDFPVKIENTDSIYSGTWTLSNNAKYSGGSCHYGNTQDGYFEATYTGTTVSWYGLKNVDLGYADVYVDGVLEANNIDCYAPVAEVVKLFEKKYLPYGTHTIKVVVDGSKNPDSSGAFLVHDYFEYDNKKQYSIAENIECVYSGTWNTGGGSIYSGGSCHYGNTTGGYFEYTFVGTSVRWYGLKNIDLGYADVYIDGVLEMDNIDCYDTTRAVHKLFEKTNLTFDYHTIRVVIAGDRNTNSLNTFLVHDFFEFFGPVGLTAADYDVNGKVTMNDFAMFSTGWLSRVCCEDIQLFSRQWLEGAYTQEK